MSHIFSDPSVCSYHTQGHPEAPFRVSKTRERLESAGHRVEAPDVAATKADVELVHSRSHFDSVRDGTFEDADTPHYRGIEKIALTSLSGALSAATSALAGAPAFSLMRPPGHHAAAARVAGFCYFNNIAIACEGLLASKKSSRVGILDVDVHHGDGTEAIFTRREGLLFCSLHQIPLYPGSGLRSHDNCLNFPLPPGTGEADYLRTLEQALQPLLDFKPEVLAVSAGFDTYKECPIAQLQLEKKTYRRIGEMIASTKLKRLAVLEGGYAEAMPILIENFLDGFFR